MTFTFRKKIIIGSIIVVLAIVFFVAATVSYTRSLPKTVDYWFMNSKVEKDGIFNASSLISVPVVLTDQIELLYGAAVPADVPIFESTALVDLKMGQVLNFTDFSPGVVEDIVEEEEINTTIVNWNNVTNSPAGDQAAIVGQHLKVLVGLNKDNISIIGNFVACVRVAGINSVEVAVSDRVALELYLKDTTGLILDVQATKTPDECELGRNPNPNICFSAAGEDECIRAPIDFSR